MEQVAQFIRISRKNLGLTQVEFARKIGVGIRFVRELESGKETTRCDKVNQVLEFLGYELGVKRREVPSAQKTSGAARIY